MRRTPFLAAGAVLVTLSACAPPWSAPEDGLTGIVAGITDSASIDRAYPERVSGSVDERGTYELFDLGYGNAGDSLTIAHAERYSPAFLVVLFDENYELLYRQVLTGSAPLSHTLRADTGAIYLGVTPTLTGSGAFDLTINARAADVPVPVGQVVWLNFAGADGVAVYTRKGISFDPFDAVMLGEQYAGATDRVKQAIIDAMRTDYADFNVVILTSDDGPPPETPYATVHFGGDDSRLLGLADNVDQYNADRWQSAIIYVESFADFWTMGLTDEEMGQMIGNVASHEVGHLLGLFHTQAPEDIMDTTGGAWDLAADQAFVRAALEPTVFPVGYENAPMRLAQTVGLRPVGTQKPRQELSSAKLLRKLELRAAAKRELRCRCGNCLELDN